MLIFLHSWLDQIVVILLVEVLVSRHPIFERQDYDVFSTVQMSYATAALGGDIRIATVDGDVLYFFLLI